VETQAKQDKNPLRVETEKLLRAIFIRGTIPRSMAAEILNMSTLIKDGLLQSQSHRTPLTIGLPLGVLPYYFPDLYDPSVIGEEYII